MKLIKNALIASRSAHGMIKKNIIYDDKIIKITDVIPNGIFSEIIDAKENILIPGGIDAHVHFNDPGFTEHEDFITGTQAASAGGITTVIDMPCTSVPPVTNVLNLHKKLSVIKEKAITDFALWGGIRRSDFPLSPKMINELWDSGIVGFKIYTISGMEDFSDLSYRDISTVFQMFPEFLFAFHAEDKSTIQENREKYKNEKNNPLYYSKIRSIEAESKAVKKILSMVMKNRLHFVHISSKKAAEMIIKAKKDVDVSFETCPHYLQFTDNDLLVKRGRLKTAPPVKYEADKKFLRECVKNENVDFITTDHAGCDFKKEKNLEEFSKIYNGIPGTQFLLPYLFSTFYNEGTVSLENLINLTSTNSAKRYGLYPQKGSLQIGTDADFTIINPNVEYLVDENKLLSKGKYSPFHGDKFTTRIEKTILRGNLIYSHEKGVCGKTGYGKWIKRENRASTNHS